MIWLIAAAKFIAKHWRHALLLAFLMAVAWSQWYLYHKGQQSGRDEYRGKLEQCQAINASLNAAAEAQNAENAKRLAQATQEQQKAVKAEAAANKAAERLLDRVSTINSQLAEAKKDPACRELLEQRVCVALR